MTTMTKVVLVLAAAMIATIMAANLAYDATANVGSEPVNEPWAQEKMEFIAWNGEKWTAWILGGGFEQIPENTAKWSRHFNPSLAFIDWDGEMWQAKIEGDEFLLAYRGDWSETVERTGAIQFRDWKDKNQQRTVAQLRR